MCLAFGKKVLQKILINKYNKYKKQNNKDQQTVKSFDIFYRKRLRDNLIDEKEYVPLCNNFTKYVDDNKNAFSLDTTYQNLLI